MKVQNLKATLMELYNRVRISNVDNYLTRYRQLISKLQQHPDDFSILSQAIKRQRITEEITEAYQHALHSGDSIHFNSEEQAAAQTLDYHLMLAAALLPNSH